MTVKKQINLAVLLSGSGTTLQNLIDRIGAGKLDAKILVVISSNPAAYGITRAKNYNIPVFVINPKDYNKNFNKFNDEIDKIIDNYNIDLQILAGFLWKRRVGDKYKNKIINIHPALLPKYGGQGMWGHHVHEAVLGAGDRESGATVHFVSDEYDKGPIILQEKTPVLPNDTVETLTERVQAAERRILPRAIQLIAEGKIRIKDRQIEIFK